jgi:hypothetical protein
MPPPRTGTKILPTIWGRHRPESGRIECGDDSIHDLGRRGRNIDRDRLLDVSRRLDLEWGATLNSAFYRYARSGRSPRVSA